MKGPRAFEALASPTGVGPWTPPRPEACGRCGEACLPAHARGGRRKVRMLVCPAPRTETRLLDLGAAVPSAADVVSPGSTPLREVRGTLYRGFFAWPSRPRLMRRRVAPFQGTAQRASSPCPRRLILHHARHRLAHPRSPRRRYAPHGFRRRRREPGGQWGPVVREQPFERSPYRRGMSTV